MPVADAAIALTVIAATLAVPAPGALVLPIASDDGPPVAVLVAARLDSATRIDGVALAPVAAALVARTESADAEDAPVAALLDDPIASDGADATPEAVAPAESDAIRVVGRGAAPEAVALDAATASDATDAVALALAATEVKMTRGVGSDALLDAEDATDPIASDGTSAAPDDVAAAVRIANDGAIPAPVAVPATESKVCAVESVDCG